MLRFRVLGRVSAYNEAGQIPLGNARQRVVLAALLIEPGRSVALDQLVDRVWGPAPPQQARSTLHSYLSRLRSVLGGAGGPVPTRRPGGYALEVDESAVDLHHFRALVAHARQAEDDGAAALWQEAMDLWQGQPFADLDNDWLQSVAAGLEAEWLAAMRDRTDVLLRGGEHARLLPELTAAASAYPLDERLAGQLLLALYRCGRQADALAHYRQLRDRLVDELGSDPWTYATRAAPADPAARPAARYSHRYRHRPTRPAGRHRQLAPAGAATRRRGRVHRPHHRPAAPRRAAGRPARRTGPPRRSSSLPSAVPPESARPRCIGPTASPTGSAMASCT